MRLCGEKRQGCCDRSAGIVSPASGLEVMVCGCIYWRAAESLAFVEGNMNSQNYFETSEKHLEPSVCKLFDSEHLILQENSASVHKSAESTRKRQHEVSILPWHCHQNLSPVKNVWSVLSNKAKNRIFLISIRDLKHESEVAFNELPRWYVVFVW